MAGIGVGSAGCSWPVIVGCAVTECQHALPLLTMLIVNEFGFFVTAIGAGVGINMILKDGVQAPLLLVVIGDAVLAIGFLFWAIRLWPGMTAG